MAPFTSVTELLRSQVEPYQRLVWFLYEAAEREHRLNLKALSDTPGALLQAWARIPGTFREISDDGLAGQQKPAK
jgi:hypothetical protein